MADPISDERFAAMKIPKTQKPPKYKVIPTVLTESQFNQFVLPHLSQGLFGPRPKISLHKFFNYILVVLYTSCQWKQLPIDKNEHGTSEINYTRIFRKFQSWREDGSLEKIFENTIGLLKNADLLDLSILHGDGSSTPAKKGGNRIGFNGHKHFKGEKVIAIVDRNVNVLAPYTIAAGNKNEAPLFKEALGNLKAIAKAVGLSIKGCIMSLDGVYDSKENRKLIFNSSMTPNIPENKRNRKKTKSGKKRLFSKQIFKERFQTIERLFAWEDKFKRLLIRFERKSENHFGMKLIAFTMINLRHFC